MEYKSLYKSPIGTIILTSDSKYLTGLWFDTTRFTELKIIEPSTINNNLPIFIQTKEWLDSYFKGENPDPSIIPLKLQGTEFRLKVWNILKEISYGKTTTYQEIAQKICKQENIPKMSSQAIGNAVGHNPISIIIPCHRVIAKDGNITGYGGGISKKIKLLEIEKVPSNTYYCQRKSKKK